MLAFVIVPWLVLTVLVGMYAQNHCNRDGFGWAVIAVVISPLLAILLLKALPVAHEQELIYREPTPSDDDPESRAIAAKWVQEIKAQWKPTAPRSARTNARMSVPPMSPPRPGTYVAGWQVKRRRA